MKFADASKASSERGGRPFLGGVSNVLKDWAYSRHYFTRSAKLRGCRGLAARLATSSSATVVELGGWAHFWVEGEG